MPNQKLLQAAIEGYWETVPPSWKKVRVNTRGFAARDFGITEIQFHFLRHIRRGFHTVAELADFHQVSRSAASQVVDQLVEKALVTRTTDPTDRRYVNLALTEKGESLLQSTFAKSRQWMGELMSPLSAQELQTVVDAMAILKRTFNID
jgi:DNA-binding MarR family transcriptional regulator